MHLKRLIVAAVLLPVLYFYIMYLPQGYFFFLLIFISLIAMSEFYHMYRVTGIFRYACLLLGISILGVSCIYHDRLMDIAAISVMILMVMRLLLKRDPVTSLADIAPLIVGLLYVPLLFSFQAELRKLGPEWIVFLYASVWASDSMAYYIGKGIGKRKLYREVSPNKTVAGAAGSLIGGITGALILRTLIVPQITAPAALFIGATIGIISVIGDLIESMFKRDAGVKDSGIIIPGHGGILDKIDGSLFAGPVLYWVLTALGIK
jgi:phosphatidate cytidylyltransferase